MNFGLVVVGFISLSIAHGFNEKVPTPNPLIPISVGVVAAFLDAGIGNGLNNIGRGLAVRGKEK